jgi:hypothetical protein
MAFTLAGCGESSSSDSQGLDGGSRASPDGSGGDAAGGTGDGTGGDADAGGAGGNLDAGSDAIALSSAACNPTPPVVAAHGGTVYYVDPSGSDSNPGSQASPWLTLQHAADSVQPGDAVVVHAGHYTGFQISTGGTASAPIVFGGDPGTVIDQSDGESGRASGIDGVNVEYVTLQGFTIAPQSNDSAWYACIRMGGQPSAWVHGNIVQNNTCTMRDVSSPNSDAMGLYSSWQDGIIVRDNEVTGTNDAPIYMANSQRNYIVRCNDISQANGLGIHNNGDVSQGNPGINTNALIENNVIHGLQTGQAISCDGVQNSRIQNNVIYDVPSKGISLFVTDAADGSKNNIVVNNTIYTANGGHALRLAQTSTGNTILDNILLSAGSSGASYDADSSALPGTVSDYNVTMDSFYVDGNPVTLSSWQTNQSLDAHSFIATAAQLFVGAMTDDFHLSATSPAIGKGTTEDAPTLDFDGNPRGSSIDIGAYQHAP